jgi:hypothetical protein
MSMRNRIADSESRSPHLEANNYRNVDLYDQDACRKSNDEMLVELVDKLVDEVQVVNRHLDDQKVELDRIKIRTSELHKYVAHGNDYLGRHVWILSAILIVLVISLLS